MYWLCRLGSPSAAGQFSCLLEQVTEVTRLPKALTTNSCTLSSCDLCTTIKVTTLLCPAHQGSLLDCSCTRVDDMLVFVLLVG
jgi:hypothetical protein